MPGHSTATTSRGACRSISSRSRPPKPTSSSPAIRTAASSSTAPSSLPRRALGLLLTWALDRSRGRIVFAYACMSAACLCPLVFGFPTEVWVMHALFWPTLAACHYARRGVAGAALILALMLALMFTHGGALISIAAILATLALRGLRDAALRRACGIALAVVTAWVIVKATLRPDDYMAAVLVRAALHVFDISILTGDFMLLHVLRAGRLCGRLLRLAAARGARASLCRRAGCRRARALLAAVRSRAARGEPLLPADRSAGRDAGLRHLRPPRRRWRAKASWHPTCRARSAR